jgi:hypothetical protein
VSATFRSLVVTATLAVATIAVAAGAPASAAPNIPRSIYVVQRDMRMCPSPLCGGYWVALANHGRTRCADGTLRARCYVAFVRDRSTGRTVSLAEGGLAAAVLTPQPTDWNTLGVLLVDATWAPVGRASAIGRFFRLRDTGTRCIRRPCFSIRADLLNSSKRPVRVSALRLGPAQTGPPRGRAERALASADGLLVSGSIVNTSSGDRVFAATQVYLRPLRPPA